MRNRCRRCGSSSSRCLPRFKIALPAAAQLFRPRRPRGAVPGACRRDHPGCASNRPLRSTLRYRERDLESAGFPPPRERELRPPRVSAGARATDRHPRSIGLPVRHRRHHTLEKHLKLARRAELAGNPFQARPSSHPSAGQSVCRRTRRSPHAIAAARPASGANPPGHQQASRGSLATSWCRHALAMIWKADLHVGIGRERDRSRP